MQHKRFLWALAACLLAGVSFQGATFADALRYDGFNYRDEVVVVGLKEGRLQTLVKGADKLYDLKKVEWIELTNQRDFNQAELSRNDANKSAALYKAALQNINDHKLRVLAELRAVGPTDADGKWSDAVADFLDVYAASPTAEVWEMRPTNIPPASSSMLKESADRLLAKAGSFSSEECKKNLNTLALELLTRANDPRAAGLARQLGTGEPAGNAANGGAAAVRAPEPAEAEVPAAGGGLEGVSSAVKARNFEAAVAQADQQLKVATGDTAIRLFELKAHAREGEKHFEEAAATLIRVAAYYPANSEAPSALLQAADLQKAMKHDDEAKHLYQEIVDKYPNSASAVHAKAQPGVTAPPPAKAQ